MSSKAPHGPTRFGRLITLAVILALCLVPVSILRGEREDDDEHEHEGHRHGGSRNQPQVQLPPAATRQVSFTKDIDPIFSDSCYDCHADGAHKGGFKMDKPSDYLKGGEEGPAVVVGHSDQSRLVRMISGVGVEREEIMPRKKPRLTAEQIGLIRAWIDQGMKFDVQPAQK